MNSLLVGLICLRSAALILESRRRAWRSPPSSLPRKDAMYRLSYQKHRSLSTTTGNISQLPRTGSQSTYSTLCSQNRPTFQRPGDIPEGQVGNSYLPERNEVQVSILLLSGSSFLVVLNRLGRLTTNEAHPTLSEQEKYTYCKMSIRLRG